MRRVINGLGALLLLVGILAGLPAILLTAGAPLLPHDLSTGGVLNKILTPDNSGSALVWLVTLVAWIAWSIFALLFVLELLNLLSGHRLNLHIPRLGGAQQLVGTLLVAVMAIGAAPATALANPTTTSGPAAAPASIPHSSTSTITAHTGDSLWSLAETHLGDGNRWTEIYQANRAIIGSNPNVLPNGLKLTLPTNTPPTKTSSNTTGVTIGDGDSLWSLAETHLGDGNRWTEIYQANRAIIGSNPNVLPNGLKLTLPTNTPPKITNTQPTKPPTTPAHAAANPTPPTTTAPAPAPARPTSPAAPTTAAPQQAQAPQVVESAAPAVAEDGEDASDVAQDGVLAAAGVLLAASLITTINRRRRRQLRERQPGQALVLPDEDAQRMETTLRRNPAPLTVERLDLILRALAKHCLDNNLPLPVLSATRLASDRIDLLLTQPHTNTPEWVQLTADGSVWTILPGDSDDLPFLREDVMEHIAAPYPALVSIGHDQADALILINLEHAGALTLTADDSDDASCALRAIALELAIGPFSDDLNLTLVGDVCPDLDQALDQPNVTRVDDVDALIVSLAQRATAQRQVLDGTTAGEQRISPDATDAWDPEIILTDQTLTSDQVDALTEILDTMPRVAIAAVTTADQDLTPWRYTIAGTPMTATLQPTDWQLTPLAVSDTDYRAVLQLLDTSRPDTTQPATWWDQNATIELDTIDNATGDEDPDLVAGTTAEASSPAMKTRRSVDISSITGGKTLDELREEAYADDTTDTIPADPDTDALDDEQTPTEEVARIAPISITRHAAGTQQPYNLAEIPDPTQNVDRPLLRILGEVELLGVDGEPTRAKRRCQEALLFILDHPGSSTTRLAKALITSPAFTKQIVTHLRGWLGTAPDGTPYLPSGVQGGYRLHPDVTSDWHLADKLLAGSIQQASTDQLAQALQLIHGVPFANASAASFAFCEPLRTHISCRLTDAALELTERALKTNDLALARWATSKALLLDTDSEALATARIRTEYQAGNFTEVDRLTTLLHTSARKLGVDLCPQTEDVLREVATR